MKILKTLIFFFRTTNVGFYWMASVFFKSLGSCWWQLCRKSTHVVSWVLLSPSEVEHQWRAHWRPAVCSENPPSLRHRTERQHVQGNSESALRPRRSLRPPISCAASKAVATLSAIPSWAGHAHFLVHSHQTAWPQKSPSPGTPFAWKGLMFWAQVTYLKAY